MPDEGKPSKQEIEWVSELDKDDVFVVHEKGRVTGGEYKLLMKFPEWHRSFFYSLQHRCSLGMSLTQLKVGLKGSERYENEVTLFENYEFDRGEGLRPIMEIRRISEMIFPLVWYSNQRRRVEDELISCIEYEGMSARGVDRWDADIVCAEFELDSLSMIEREQRRERYASVSVHIDDVEKMISVGAIGWRVAKYLIIWRYYLDERATKANKITVPSVQNNVQVLEDKKSKMREETIERHEAWFQCACDIIDNWDTYKNKYIDKQLSANKVCEKVAEKMSVGADGVKKAISQRIGLYIKELRKK